MRREHFEANLEIFPTETYEEIKISSDPLPIAIFQLIKNKRAQNVRY